MVFLVRKQTQDQAMPAILLAVNRPFPIFMVLNLLLTFRSSAMLPSNEDLDPDLDSENGK